VTDELSYTLPSQRPVTEERVRELIAESEKRTTNAVMDAVGRNSERSLGWERCRGITWPAWRPIAEAPRDGTAVLVNVPVRGYIARQDCVPASWIGPQDCHGWISSTSGHRLTNTPTHWMPLPPPPGEEPGQ
jgi:hypothetical protein